MRPQNECGACGKDFTSLAAFDRHRIGPHDGNRRCMTTAEILKAGMKRNEKGRWYIVDATERARERFAQPTIIRRRRKEKT